MNMILKFQTLLLISIHLIEINSECDKETPILKDNKCKEVYCTENEFQEGICSINNPIIKKQWLNEIIHFGEEIPSFFLPIQITSENIIFISFEESKIYIYRLNELSFPNNIGISKNKYNNYTFSHLDFLNGLILKISEESYPFICDINNCVLIDFDLDFIYIEQYTTISGFVNDNSWKYLKLLNINEENKIVFVTVLSDSISLLSCDIIEKNLSVINNCKSKKVEDNIKSKQLSCFITENKFIICLYFINCKYKLLASDSSLINITTQNINEEIELGYDLFENAFYGIHLRQEIGVITYYTKNRGRIQIPLYMEIIKYNSEDKKFEYIIEKYLITISDLSDHDSAFGSTYEHLIKINNNSFSYAYYDDNSNNFIIVLFNLYGNNNQDLIVRYYKINISLNSFKFDYYLNLFVYKSFLGIGFAGTLRRKEKHESFFIIFGYNNNTNTEYKINLFK